MLQFSNFEETIDPTILERGRLYFKQARVGGLVEVAAGQWQATVQGTDDYTVTIELDDDTIVDATCTCPYDFGPVCKHVVSVFFHLKAKRDGLPPPVGKLRQNSQKNCEAKSRTAPNPLDHPNRLSPSLLRQLVAEAAERDPYIANQVKLIQQSGQAPLSKVEVRQMIRASFRAARGRDGDIPWDRTDQAAEGAAQLLEEAESLLGAGQFGHALPILEMIVTELVPALQDVDDSDGVVGGLIEGAFQLLEQLVGKLADKSLRADCFNRWLTESADPNYAGWEWGWSWLELASRLVGTDEQQAALFAACDRLAGLVRRRAARDEAEAETGFVFAAPNEHHSTLTDYDAERAAVIKASVFEQRATDEALIAFLIDHRLFPEIRTMLLKRAEANRDSHRIRSLAEEGIALSESAQLPGLTIEWTKWLLRAAELEGDQAEIRQRTEQLFLETGDWAYYDRLKTSVPAERWRVQVDRLLERMSGRRFYRVNSIDQRGELCRREKLWDELLQLLSDGLKSPMPGTSQFPTIDRFHRYLAPRFPEKLTELYAQAVRAQLDAGSIPAGRAAYQESARMLRRMKQLGARERVQQIVAELCQKHPRRRAMLEELQLVTQI